MRAILLSSVSLMLFALPAKAGPNAGGVLLLHANEGLVWSVGNDYCGLAGLQSCSLADVRVDAPSAVIIYLLAAFPPATNPRLAGMTVGIGYDASSIFVEHWQTCADFELPTGNPAWPAPNSGNAMTWHEANTTHVVEAGWFVAYSYTEDPAILAIIDHPQGGTIFADDDVPSILDEVADFGTLGFNTDGHSPCPPGAPWDASFELVPSKLTVYQPCGGSFPVELWINGATDLGDFSICAGYDGALLSVSDVVVDDGFLGSTGRPVFPLPTEPCTSECETAGVRVGAHTGASGPEGASGEGRLAQIVFTPSAAVSATSTICLDDWSVHDTQQPFPGPISVTGGTSVDVVHNASCFGDFNGDGDVTVFDLAAQIPRWGRCVGESGYNAIYDVNLLEPLNYCASFADGCVDAGDIQRVAGRWHLGCTAAAPAPPIGDPPQPTVRLSYAPEIYAGAPGDTFSIDLVVENVADLGAYEVEVSSLSRLKFHSVEHVSFLGSTGRTPYSFTTVIEPGFRRWVRFGACTVGDTPGAGGTGVLARVVVELVSCDAWDDPTTVLKLENVMLTFSDGEPQELFEAAGDSFDVTCDPASAPAASGAELTMLTSRPNPLSTGTEITFRVPGSGGDAVQVDLSIFDVGGRLVRTLVSTQVAPGDHLETWDARDQSGARVPNGTYFSRLVVGGSQLEERIVVLR